MDASTSPAITATCSLGPEGSHHFAVPITGELSSSVSQLKAELMVVLNAHMASQQMDTAVEVDLLEEVEEEEAGEAGGAAGRHRKRKKGKLPS